MPNYFTRTRSYTTVEQRKQQERMLAAKLIDESGANASAKVSTSESTMDEELISYNDIIEEETVENPQFMLTYQAEIQSQMLLVEKSYLASPNYMVEVQREVNAKMRQILVDWIEEVHQKFKLRAHTLFMTVNLIDRYLSTVYVRPNQLQLVGVTAIFIASKYEEIYPRPLKDFVYICDHAYTKNQILQMEGQILTAINFMLTYVSPIRFLESYLLEQDSNPAILESKQFYLASYLLEMLLHNLEGMRFCPSVQAMAALFLARNIMGVSGDLIQKNNQKEEVIRCAKLMVVLFKMNESYFYPAVKRKYCREEVLHVGLITCPV